MSLKDDLLAAATKNGNEARKEAMDKKLPGPEIGKAALEGRWVGMPQLMSLPAVATCRAEAQLKIKTLLKDYAAADWMIDPASGPKLADSLKASKFRIGTDASGLVNDGGQQSLIDVLLVIDGLIEEESLFSAHGAPTAEGSKLYPGIAVKFAEDHLGNEAKDASSISARRALTRSSVLQSGEAKVLSAEIKALNDCRFFQLVEAHLVERYGWMPQTTEVESICYVSREPIKVGWEVTGSQIDPTSNKPTKFSKPAKATGHLMYAVKPDQADPNAASDPQKCKRLLYHFEALLADPNTPPTGGGKTWEKLALDSIVKAAGKKELVEAARRAAVVVYYMPG